MKVVNHCRSLYVISGYNGPIIVKCSRLSCVIVYTQHHRVTHAGTREGRSGNSCTFCKPDLFFSNYLKKKNIPIVYIYFNILYYIHHHRFTHVRNEGSKCIFQLENSIVVIFPSFSSKLHTSFYSDFINYDILVLDYLIFAAFSPCPPS